MSTLTSSLAGVYTEKILKETSSSMWIENIQMGILGTIFSLIYALKDINIIIDRGLFFGWNNVTSALVLNQAIGGLIVSAALKYTSALTKSIIGSLIMVLGTLFSVILLGSELNIFLIIGASIALVSTNVFSLS